MSSYGLTFRMVKICEVADTEGPPVTLAKMENDESYKIDSGHGDTDIDGTTGTSCSDIVNSSGTIV